MAKVEISMPFYEARISVTGKCNHKCKYCGSFSDGKAINGYRNLSLDQVSDLALLLKNKGLHVQLTGGEPTLKKDLDQIIRILSKGGVKDIGLTTNGSILSPEYAQRLFDAGISDIHIHVPSLDCNVFERTTRNKRKNVINRIIKTAIYLKAKCKKLEFNTPITSLNLPTLPQLMEFCYLNEINFKLIEEVNLTNAQVSEKQIISEVERWFQKKGLNLDETRIDKRYGRIYNLGNFSFRIAPATKGLTDYLTGKSDTILYDGRYWIGGRDKNFVFTPSYFLRVQSGNLRDLELNLNETIDKYNEIDKK